MSYEASVSDVHSSTSFEFLTFGGRPSEDVTAFLGAVKRIAILQGRDDDDRWIISYVESCLRGDAMRWFDLKTSTSNPFVQWSDVRRLFLSHFNNYVSPSNAPPATTAATPRTQIVGIPSKAPTPSSVVPPKGSLQTLIVGDSGVGKSCLLTRHCGHGWTPSSSPTQGIHFEVFKANYSGKPETQYYWDVAGEQYRNTDIAPYCAWMERIWIVYDITDKISFDSVRSWHKLVQQYAPAKVMFRLVGNKRDLVDARAITSQQGRDLSKELGIPDFFEMSALTNEGVQDMRFSWLPVFTK